jgi:hypothetical protein
MANMTDQNRVNAIMQALFTSSTTFTITPGTGGGSAFLITPPFHLRLMTTQGSNTANGTEATAGNCPGYTALGATLGTTFCAAPSAGTQTNANSVSWTATGTWSAIPSIEIWDTAATPLRWLQGALTSSITGVVNGDTVQFAAGSITLSAAAW